MIRWTRNEIELEALRVFGFRADCPVCGQAAEGETTSCRQCSTPHHEDCWIYNDGCAVYGCGDGESRSAPAPLTPPAASFRRRLLQSLIHPGNPDHRLQLMSGIALTLGTVWLTLVLVMFVGFSRMAEHADRELRERWIRFRGINYTLHLSSPSSQTTSGDRQPASAEPSGDVPQK